MRFPASALLAALLLGSPPSALAQAIRAELSRAPAAAAAVATLRRAFFDGARTFDAAIDAQLNVLPPTPDAAESHAASLDALAAQLTAQADAARAADPETSVEAASLALAARARAHTMRGGGYLIAPNSDLFVGAIFWAGEGAPDGAVDVWERAIAAAEKTPLLLMQLRENLEAARAFGRYPARRIVDFELQNCEAFARIAGERLEGLDRLIPEGSAPTAYRARREAAARTLADAFAAHGRYLQASILPFAKDAYPVGRDEYAWLLKNTLLLRESPETLRRSGRAMARRIRKRMERLAGQLMPGKPLAEVMAELANDHPADDAALLAEYRMQADRAAAFASDRGLFEVPDEVRHVPIRPTPDRFRATLPIAAFWHDTVLVTTAEGDPARLKAHSRSMIPYVAVHEGVPGHALHYVSVADPERARKLSAAFQRAGAETSALAVEGYAFYVEALMGRRGFYTPAQTLAQLKGELLRALRVYVDPSLHMGKLTLEQAARLLERESFLAPHEAEAEVLRYMMRPGQAVTYVLGRRQIERAKSIYRKLEGRGYTEKAFHAAFFAFGFAPPILIGAALARLSRRRRRERSALGLGEG